MSVKERGRTKKKKKKSMQYLSIICKDESESEFTLE